MLTWALDLVHVYPLNWQFKLSIVLNDGNVGRVLECQTAFIHMGPNQTTIGLSPSWMFN